MPLITPPPDDTPTNQEAVPEGEMSEARRKHFESFLTAKPWICGKCRLTNHGWNIRCANWKCKAERQTT